MECTLASGKVRRVWHKVYRSPLELVDDKVGITPNILESAPMETRWAATAAEAPLLLMEVMWNRTCRPVESRASAPTDLALITSACVREDKLFSTLDANTASERLAGITQTEQSVAASFYIDNPCVAISSYVLETLRQFAVGSRFLAVNLTDFTNFMTTTAARAYTVTIHESNERRNLHGTILLSWKIPHGTYEHE